MSRIDSRRNFLRLTTAGFIHISAVPFLESVDGAELSQNPELMIRTAQQRGHSDLGWLKSYHTFSFGKYYDQRHMGFRSLRVINDDRITAGRGFPTHPHRDMEILSFVMEGSLQHRDSTGEGSIIRPGDIQRMSAGRGITHSEYNPSKTESNHFLQVWIKPAQRGLRPSYEQKTVDSHELKNQWKRVVAPSGQGASVSIHQDVQIFSARLDSGQSLEYRVNPDRHAWLHVSRGRVNVNGEVLAAGDAAAISQKFLFQLTGTEQAELLMFDMG